MAGALLAGVGLIACFAVNAASYVPFIAIAFWILPRGRAATSGLDRRHPFAGMRATLGDRRLRGALLTVLATGLFSGPLITFMPVLVRLELHGDSGVFSATITAFGVGGLLGAGGVLAIDPARDHRARSSWLAALLGVLVVLAGLDPWRSALPAIGAAAGAAMTSSNTLANAVIQQTSRDDLRGQAVSMYMLAMRGGAALGSLATGAGIRALGVRGALVVDGVIAITLQLAIWRANALRQPAHATRGMR